jgi:hypothetical protein
MPEQTDLSAFIDLLPYIVNIEMTDMSGCFGISYSYNQKWKGKNGAQDHIEGRMADKGLVDSLASVQIHTHTGGREGRREGQTDRQEQRGKEVEGGEGKEKKKRREKKACYHHHCLLPREGTNVSLCLCTNKKDIDPETAS